MRELEMPYKGLLFYFFNKNYWLVKFKKVTFENLDNYLNFYFMKLTQLAKFLKSR